MSSKPLGTKVTKTVVKWEIKRLLSQLASTRNEKEFYQKFDKILQGLYKFAGPNQAAMENVAKAFRQRHPWSELSRVLLQEQLSKITRERLAENFFCDWVTEAKKRDKLEENHFKVPWFFVISPTVACNLHCYGCYAHEYSRGQGLSYQTLDRILREAEELGIRFLTISGGEPFYYKDRQTKRDIIDLFEEHQDMFFQVYTNGTLLDDKKIERLAKIGNVAPAISVEGFKKETDQRRGKGVWEKIEEARKKLHQAGIMQGFSITVTRQNAELVSSEEFIDYLISQHCSFGWYFIYIPIGKEPVVDLMPTPEQRTMLRKRAWKYRSEKPIFMGDFWNDGPWTGGCIAGGRKYFHINSQGDIEPCVFIHFAVDNIEKLWKEGKGLRDAITSPFFLSIRKEQLNTNDNYLTPCTIIDKPEILRKVVKEYGAYPTHNGAETIIQGEIACFLDKYSKEMDRITRPDFERMIAGEFDSSIVKLSEVIKNHREKNRREVEIQSKKDRIPQKQVKEKNLL